MNFADQHQPGSDGADGSSTWHVVKEKRLLKHRNGSSTPYEHISLRRDDGMIFESGGLGRPGEFVETFLIKGSFGELKFQGSRYDMHKGITDTYIVYLFPPYLLKDKEQLAKSISGDIESGLLHYPVHPIFNGIPVKDVVFQTSIGYSPETVKHAREM
jgi:hypothetical protein